MLHWAVKKIFFLNREQIPQCDSRTCAPVTTLLKSYLPTVVADNCKQAKLLLVKYDAGHPPHSIWVTLMRKVCACVCIVTGMFQIWKVDEKHPSRHVTAAAVGSLLQEYISCSLPTHCEERRWEDGPHTTQSGQWPGECACLT